ncbi:MAG TPA: hypothetical protein VND22_04315 [Actinomycetota bacterium]|nr:hypothetical protein [Actinomycetota bacterium]
MPKSTVDVSGVDDDIGVVGSELYCVEWQIADDKMSAEKTFIGRLKDSVQLQEIQIPEPFSSSEELGELL